MPLPGPLSLRRLTAVASLVSMRSFWRAVRTASKLADAVIASIAQRWDKSRSFFALFHFLWHAIYTALSFDATASWQLTQTPHMRRSLYFSSTFMAQQLDATRPLTHQPKLSRPSVWFDAVGLLVYVTVEFLRRNWLVVMPTSISFSARAGYDVWVPLLFTNNSARAISSRRSLFTHYLVVIVRSHTLLLDTVFSWY